MLYHPKSYFQIILFSLVFATHLYSTENNADDVCYMPPIQEGTRTITPIKSLANITNTIIYFDTSSLIDLPFFSSIDDCSVDDGAKSENCQEDSNGNTIGPVGIFNAGGWTFELNDVTTDQDRSISTYNDNSFFDFISNFFSTQGAIQASYTKDGVDYEGAISQCSQTTIYSGGARDFKLINPSDTQNIIGNTQIVGNTVECVTTTAIASSADYSSLQCDNTVGDYNNNNYVVKYIDIDDDNLTYNSSSATIQLPSTYKKIAWVGLYWQAHINNNSYIYYHNRRNYLKSSDMPSGGIQATTANKIKLKIDSGEYKEVTAQTLDYFADSSDAEYSAFADITNYFTENYTPNTNIKVTIANITTSQGRDYSLGNYGAWTLVVVYKEDELNSLSKLRNNSVYLGYQYVSSRSGDREIVLENFILPKKGSVESQMAVFAAEGEYRYKPDTMELDSTSLGDPDVNNVFDARLSNFIRNPSMINNNGIDIDVFNTSDIMTTKRDDDPNSLSYSATISLTSDEDLYFPSMVSFTTELYKPRVCYYIDTIKDSSGTIIFEDKAFTQEITAGEEYTFDLIIANMRANLADGIEDADLVQIYMKMTDLNYTAESTSIQNSLQTDYVQQTDEYSTNNSNDLGDYNPTTTTSNWRLGIDASNTNGGKLVSVDSLTDANNAHIKFKGDLALDDNATSINLLDYLEFKASYRTDGLIITPENASLIVQCVDLNTSGAVAAAPIGAFNVVQTNFLSNTDPLDPSATENRLPTQVSARDFNVKVLSLASDNVTLSPYPDDINVSLIPTPAYTGDTTTDQILCNGAVPYAGTTQTIHMLGLAAKNISINNTSQATKSASFKITYNLHTTPESVCSRDVFAIRPNKFILVAPSGRDIDLLKAGVTYNFTLNAVQDGSNSTTLAYNISHANTVLTLLNDKYKPDGTLDNNLKGALNFANVFFDIINGVSKNTSGNSESVGITFDDVGYVDLKFQDQTWSQVDIDNGDTVADCSANGAYICGDINATFIPDHFALSAVSLNNYTNNNTTHNFTYLSNDLNVSAALNLTITAQNASGNPTENFDLNSWENDITASFIINGTALTPNKNEISTAVDLDFVSGAQTILNTQTDTNKNLIFNFPRTSNLPQNPFKINGADINITVSSLYITSGGALDIIRGSNTANANATFVYGRTHAPRQRFVGNNGNVIIYYETYCDGGGCPNALLPNGTSSVSTDDPRWFVNSKHFVQSGNVGTVSQKVGADVSVGAITETTVATVPVTYNSANTKGYPFKTTMENNASTWLIYNKYSATSNSNEFEIEFTNNSSKWAGQHETNTTTNINSSGKTSRRTMW